MKQVRSGVFETNSSSTHSLTICTEEEFEKWQHEEMLLDTYNDKLVKNAPLTEEEKLDAQENYNFNKRAYWKDWEQLSDEEKKSWYDKYSMNVHRQNSYQFKTYSDWYDSYDSLERYSRHYTSPSGDRLVIFGKYGYNG